MEGRRTQFRVKIFGVFLPLLALYVLGAAPASRIVEDLRGRSNRVELISALYKPFWNGFEYAPAPIQDSYEWYYWKCFNGWQRLKCIK